MVFFFGVAWLYKNIIWLSLVVGGLLIAYQMAKNKRLTPKMFLVFVFMILAIWFLGSFFGLLAMGTMNQKASITISVSNEAQPLAYGDVNDPQQSTFSFTCMSPLAETVGCRLAPYTYRPITIKVCNKDPELPIPPSILVVMVDGPSLKPNDQITLRQIQDYWGGDVQAGDVFITAGDRIYWWDDVVAWLKGQNVKITKGAKYQVFYITEPIAPGKCVEFGKDQNGNPTLFLVVSKGAKINEWHILQVAMLETVRSDKVLAFSQSTLQSIGSWFGKIPVIGGVLEGVAQAFVSIILFLPNTIANYFAMNDARTVFVVGAYKFLVAYPIVEIIIVLGVIGVLTAIVTKMMGIW
jgi:hypothetical protein